MRKCKTCLSPHRVEYENLYLNEKWDVYHIWNKAIKEYGESVSYQAMARHFQHHVESIIAKRKEIDKARNDMLGKYLQEDIEVAKRINEHMEIVEKQIKAYATTQKLDPEEIRVILELINSARLSIEQLLKWRDKLMPKEKPIEDLATKLMDIVNDFPQEYLEKFSKRLNELVESERLG